MDKSDIKDNLDRTGFVFTDVDTPGGRVRVTARGPRVPGGEVGRKTTVKAQRGKRVRLVRRGSGLPGGGGRV